MLLAQISGTTILITDLNRSREIGYVMDVRPCNFPGRRCVHSAVATVTDKLLIGDWSPLVTGFVEAVGRRISLDSKLVGTVTVTGNPRGRIDERTGR